MGFTNITDSELLSCEVHHACRGVPPSANHVLTSAMTSKTSAVTTDMHRTVSEELIEIREMLNNGFKVKKIPKSRSDELQIDVHYRIMVSPASDNSEMEVYFHCLVCSSEDKEARIKSTSEKKGYNKGL